MKKILYLLLIIFVFFVLPVIATASPVEEKDLPPEADTRPLPGEGLEPTITFEGYVNSRDVTIVGGVMGCVYYFCKSERNDFCSDQEGILIVTGAETGNIPQIIKTLDAAISNQSKLIIRLSESSYFSGIRKIIDIKLLDSSI